MKHTKFYDSLKKRAIRIFKKSPTPELAEKLRQARAVSEIVNILLESNNEVALYILVGNDKFCELVRNWAISQIVHLLSFDPSFKPRPLDYLGNDPWYVGLSFDELLHLLKDQVKASELRKRFHEISEVITYF